ncbi:MAG: hypothetical protein U0269_33550 [Polyangiales bacterium]
MITRRRSTARSSLATLALFALACAPSTRQVAQTERRTPLVSPVIAQAEDARAANDPVVDPQPSADATAPHLEPVAPTAPRSLATRLSEHEVDDDYPWRQTVYSWLTPQRAQELAQHRQVLTATTHSGPYVSPFSRILARLQRRRDRVGAIAHALYVEPDLYRYRYGWSSPFATAMGFRGQPYGTALVRVDLRDDALVLRLDTQDPQLFRLFDREQREVPIDRFQQARARIGAVYHVRRGGDVKVAFREYVLCNSAAIAHWSVGTQAIRDEVGSELRLVEEVLAEWGPHATRPSSTHAGIEREWRGGTRSPQRTPFMMWAATMATAAPHYYLETNNLLALLAQLRQFDSSTTYEE